MTPARRIRQRQGLFDLRGKSVFFALCLDEGLYDTDTGDHFLDQGTHGSGVVLNRGREGFQLSSEDLGHKDEQGSRIRVRRQSRQFIVSIRRRSLLTKVDRAVWRCRSAFR